MINTSSATSSSKPTAHLAPKAPATPASSVVSAASFAQTLQAINTAPAPTSTAAPEPAAKKPVAAHSSEAHPRTNTAKASPEPHEKAEAAARQDESAAEDEPSLPNASTSADAGQAASNWLPTVQHPATSTPPDTGEADANATGKPGAAHARGVRGAHLPGGDGNGKPTPAAATGDTGNEAAATGDALAGSNAARKTFALPGMAASSNANALPTPNATTPAAGASDPAAASASSLTDSSKAIAPGASTGSNPSALPAFMSPAVASTASNNGEVNVNSAAAKPTVRNIDAPFGTPAFAPALGAQVSLLAKDGVQQAQLQLNPADMGPITVQISVTDGQANVNFAADLAATRQAIEASLPDLATSLREAGLTLTGGGVSQQSQQSSNFGQPSGRGDDAPTGSRGSRSVSSAGATADAGITSGPRGDTARAQARQGLLDTFV